MATDPNSPEAWDRIWSDPAEAEWRTRALADVYDRICELVPDGSRVVDLGGGVGTLARRLGGVVLDHSSAAVAKAPPGSRVVDLNAVTTGVAGCDFYVSTECMEHLSAESRAVWLDRAASTRGLLVSVPNNRLGPEEEPQHTIKWTALEFLTELREHFEHCRVEVLGPFLLGVCGELAAKSYRMSVCTPARNEEADIERVLASFRGVADQLVVGIDPRSSDRTEEIARQYADLAFTLEEPDGPADDKAPAVHMSHIRNQCIERCDGDWIFMTEAHESLKAGHDALLALDQLADGVRVGFVLRTGAGQQWGFPWLFRNDPRIRFTRATHNELMFPTSYLCVKLPEIKTDHHRSRDTIERRRAQRKVQNRLTLTDDWVRNGNDSSLLYLGSEWAEYDSAKAIGRLKEFLAVNRNNGPKRYHARLVCAKLLAQHGDLSECRTVLINAAADDWSRVDHWFYLGDLALLEERTEEALQFYRYAATMIEHPPFTMWWVDQGIYGYLTAQRLTQCYADLGRLAEALQWAERTVALLPEDSPQAVREEAEANVAIITEAIEKHAA